jgi:hypothetical protein
MAKKVGMKRWLGSTRSGWRTSSSRKGSGVDGIALYESYCWGYLPYATDAERAKAGLS